MAASFKLISWTPYKKRFDLVMFGLISLFLITYCVTLGSIYPNIQPQLLIIKATGSLATIMLHFILIIGPLSRFNKKFLPLLYNRRHVGVTMFFITLIHGVLSLLYYQGFGIINPISALFMINTDFGDLTGFPFMILGFLALIIFFIMAVTSHDYWLEKLSARGWKYLHMSVYLAYALIVAHVFTGALQADVHPGLYAVFIIGLGTVVVVHLSAALRTHRLTQLRIRAISEGWMEVCDTSEIEENRAKVVNIDDQSIAIFKYDNKLSAVANYCKHQGGPLGEGKIVDGCITCPWHGYQYLPINGCSPPPFQEKVSTYDLKLVGSKILVDPVAKPEGTEVEPIQILANGLLKSEGEFFIGWASVIPQLLALWLKKTVVGVTIMMLLLGLILPRLSEPLKDSSFTFGDLQDYEGVLWVDPVPRLTIGEMDYLLVDFGKISANKSIMAYEATHQISLDKRMVKINGTACSYKGRTIIELSAQEASIIVHNEEVIVEPTPLNLGAVNLRGEIIDPKCYFGVMNPGDGPVHKSCAALCIKGGIPAVVYDESLDEYYIIRGENGEDINESLVPLASEEVRISGDAYSINNWNYVNVKSDIIRLSFKNIIGKSTGTMCL